MKRKTLMTMAVAGTFGLSAAAFAGSGHEVITPFSASDAGENILSHQKGFSDSYLASSAASNDMSSSALGSTSSETSASLGGSYDSFALADDGTYSDFYVVTWEPVMLESWDLYVLNTGDMNELGAADEFAIGVPTHELAVIDSDDSGMTLAFVPVAEIDVSQGD